MATQQENFEQIGKLLENIDIAMFTTRGTDGYPVSRPLSTQQAAFDGHLWFMVNANSDKVAEIRRDPRVNVGYASKERNTYVSCSGNAEVVRDPIKIDALWNDGYKAFFPGGKDDPLLTLIRVDVGTLEYWDGPGTWLGKAVSFVIARITKDDEAMGRNRTLRVKPDGRAVEISRGDSGGRDGRNARAARKATKSARKITTGRGTASKTAKKAGSRTAVGKKATKKTTSKKAVAKKVPVRSAAKKAAKKTAKKAASSRKR